MILIYHLIADENVNKTSLERIFTNHLELITNIETA